MTSLQSLVLEYKNVGSEAIKAKIVKESEALVKSIVSKIKKPNSILTAQEDLESIGMMGLLQALESYQNDKDVQFNTFAYYRIRGNIIDYLRSIDELSRNQRSTIGKSYQIVSQLQQQLGRDPQDYEVAQKLGVSEADYHKVQRAAFYRTTLSLDVNTFDEGGFSLFDLIGDSTFGTTDEELLKTEEAKIIETAILRLKEREQLILSLYYYEELNLHEISNILNLTEARISQILGKILVNLKATISQMIAA